MKICLTRFNEDAWTQHIQYIFDQALKNQFKTEVIIGYPSNDKNYDLIIICGIRGLIKDKVDLVKIKKQTRYIFDMADYISDKRTSIEDITFYFVKTDTRSEKFRFLPKPIYDNLLYPEHEINEPLTIFVDHFAATNDSEIENSKKALQKIFDELDLCPFPIRVFYQHSSGIIENPKNPEFPIDTRKLDFKFLPFHQICKYYRKTHIFFPTHLESQGMLAQEIALCGGITVMQSWMYPANTIDQFSKIIYKANEKINWQALKNFMTTEQIKKNRNLTLIHCNFEKFQNELNTIINNFIKDRL